MEAAKMDGDRLLQLRDSEVQQQLRDLREFFSQGDTDGNGCLNLEEFEAMLENKKVKAFFLSIGVDSHEAISLYHAVDCDESGTVD
eukprot:CAMPEP_0204358664 /NCGR_PEP_ID=MMETSP0469-20131031/36691_1 /ASSEMBLY_ACC=CAM_ASM_000384 /TAXON_ID=2969 /ORGANISM="Oxyrrhis marina" /LENGTH=85 /DNA_ID=CAMNT_0051346573 /DNA_START=1 /DNA_END=255 /DNA_ORIENTATION=-